MGDMGTEGNNRLSEGAANLKEELETEKMLEILSETLAQNTGGAPRKVVKSLLGGTSLRPGCVRARCTWPCVQW